MHIVWLERYESSISIFDRWSTAAGAAQTASDCCSAIVYQGESSGRPPRYHGPMWALEHTPDFFHIVKYVQCDSLLTEFLVLKVGIYFVSNGM